MVKLRNIYIDDFKIQAKASRHNAVSYEYIIRLEEQLEGQIDKLLKLANTQNDKKKNQQPAISEKLKRRKERHEKIKLATEVVAARAAQH